MIMTTTLLLMISCQQEAPAPLPISFDYSAQYPLKVAGPVQVTLKGEITAPSTITLNYAAKTHIHAKTIEGPYKTIVTRYHWSGALPPDQTDALLAALSGSHPLPTPEDLHTPTLSIQHDDGSTTTGAAGALLEPTLNWLIENRTKETPLNEQTNLAQ